MGRLYLYIYNIAIRFIKYFFKFDLKTNKKLFLFVLGRVTNALTGTFYVPIEIHRDVFSFFTSLN